MLDVHHSADSTLHSESARLLHQLSDPRDEVAELGELILKSKAFRRLYGISFLGALSPGFPGWFAEPAPNSLMLRSDGSRGAHSVGVATIALLIAEHLEWPDDLRRYAVAWGLVHDIATWPLSHTAEPGFSRLTRTTADGLRRMIVTGDRRLPSEFTVNRQLREMGVLPARLLQIFEKTCPIFDDQRHYALWKLSRSPLTPDTLEGIWRSAYAFGIRCPAPAAIAVHFRSFDLFDIALAPKALTQIVAFWKAKSDVYANHINSWKAVLWESSQSQVVERLFPKLDVPSSLQLDEIHVLHLLRSALAPRPSGFIDKYKFPRAYFLDEKVLFALKGLRRPLPLELVSAALQQKKLVVRGGVSFDEKENKEESQRA